MKLIYKGKFNGDPDSLPHGEHKPNAVKFREPENTKQLALVANLLAIGIILVCLFGLYLRANMQAFSLIGACMTFLSLYPHEFLHAVCFKKEVYLYTNWSQGLLFVVGTEDMSKARFIVMSLLPNLVFVFLPYLIFLLFPQCNGLGTFGAIAIGMGAGDYLNVFFALTQMPKGARTYLYGFHSYWYMPQNNQVS